MCKNKKHDFYEESTEYWAKTTVMCECTRRVYVGRVNKKGWTVCDHCGKRILHPRDTFKNKLLEAIEKANKQICMEGVINNV